MLTVGITGGIGSGKSTVCKCFAALGVLVCDTDALAKNLYNNDASLRDKVASAFGKEVIAHGEINKSVLANIVFNNAIKMDLLNSIVHPIVLQATEQWQNEQVVNTPYFLRESALLIESGNYKKVDAVLGVSAPVALRVQRVMQRSNFTEQHVLARINSQMPEEEKAAHYNYKILNDGSQLLMPQVLNVHEHLLALAAQKK